MNRSNLRCRTLFSLFAFLLLNICFASTASAMDDQEIPMTAVQGQAQAAAAPAAVPAAAPAVDPGLGAAAAGIPGWVGPTIGGLSVFGASTLTALIVISIIYGSRDPCDPNNATFPNETICDNTTECYNLTRQIWDCYIAPLCFNNQLNMSTLPR